MSTNTFSYFEIQKELTQFIENNEIPKNLVKFTYELDEFKVQVLINNIDTSTFFHIIKIAKKYIENWRIHTVEDGFLSLQSLNKNVFNTENILKNMKIRVSSILGSKQIEITKKTDLTQAEFSLILEVIEYVCNKESSSQSALESLNQTGCNIYFPNKETLDFSSFAGNDYIKNEILELIIFPLKNPEIYQSIAQKTNVHEGNNLPKAVLFSGPPGVGKTSMARIIAKEANCLLLYIPIENILSSYYGESSKRLADIFDNAFKMVEETEYNFLILFLDEIDALAISRNDKTFEATRQLLSVLLRKIDGIETQGNCLTIGATNRKEDLDHALISRFDNILEFAVPGVAEIVDILKLYARHLKKTERKELAENLVGYSPRDIKNFCKKVERSYATYLIQNTKTSDSKDVEITAPSIEHYLAKFKNNSTPEKERRKNSHQAMNVIGIS